MTEVPKPPQRTESYISSIIWSYLSISPLSRSIWVLAVSAPPGMGDQMMTGEEWTASGGRK